MKKVLGIIFALVTIVALTITAYVDTGKSSPEKSQTAQIQAPGEMIMVASISAEFIVDDNAPTAMIPKTVVEVNTANSSSVAFAIPTGSTEMNLSSIAKTENYTGSLVKSDVANMSVVDTNQAVNEKTGVSLSNATNSMVKDLVMAGHIYPLITVASMSTTTGISVNMVSDNFSGNFQKG